MINLELGVYKELSRLETNPYKIIIYFGLVSLFGDIIYESARGAAPPFLNYLGASAIIVGLTFGLGEFLGYGLRLISGILADITKAYSKFYVVGYLFIIVIPFLGLVSHWQLAVILIIAERVAKAIRSPARDTLISIASKDIGAGKAFGLHELLDQIGAAIGPGLLTLILLFTSNNYRVAFTFLFLPFLVMMLIIFKVYHRVRDISVYNEEDVAHSSTLQKGMPKKFWLYTSAIMMNVTGLMHISLLLYKTSLILLAWMVVLIYLFVQIIDAASAPISGLFYDKYGRLILVIPFILSVLPSILGLYGGIQALLIGSMIFGLVYGMQESIYKAAVSDMVPINYRGTAYGIFNGVYGFGFLLSGLIYGYFIENDLLVAGFIYTLLMQIIAILLLIYSIRR